MGVIELLIPMRHEKCERKIRRALAMLPGISTLDIDRKLQKVTVTGNVDPKKLMKRLSKTGKHVELWPQHQFDPTLATYARFDEVEETMTYSHDYGMQTKYKPLHDDKVTTMFSEDNPNAACSIM